MKKITFLAFLFAFNLNAQTFPGPYCSISSDFEDIEEITAVNFGGASITNSSASSIHLNFLSTTANVSPGQSYTLEVKGNTVGNYDNEFLAFIDWNQNGTFESEDETFYIGLITNSTGSDNKVASTSIAVPSTALLGTTRIRIVKVWTDESDFYFLNPDPCSISVEDAILDEIIASYGQAVDFSVNVASLNTNQFEKNLLSVYPNPVKDILNVKYASEISEVKVYNLIGQEILSKEVGLSDFQFDISNLSSGTYVARLFSNAGQHSFKLIKE